MGFSCILSYMAFEICCPDTCIKVLLVKRINFIVNTVYVVIFAGSNFRGFGSKICTLIFAVFNFRSHW